MKKIFFVITAATIALCSFSSCSEDENPDWIVSMETSACLVYTAIQDLKKARLIKLCIKPMCRSVGVAGCFIVNGMSTENTGQIYLVAHFNGLLTHIVDLPYKGDHDEGMYFRKTEQYKEVVISSHQCILIFFHDIHRRCNHGPCLHCQISPVHCVGSLYREFGHCITSI